MLAEGRSCSPATQDKGITREIPALADTSDTQLHGAREEGVGVRAARLTRRPRPGESNQKQAEGGFKPATTGGPLGKGLWV